MIGFLFVGAQKGHVVTAEQHALCKNNPRAYTQPGLKSPLATKAPCYIFPKTDASKSDVFDLGTMLTAANVDLDNMGYNKVHSIRFNGLTIIGSIEYTNFDVGILGGKRPPTYLYNLVALTESSYKYVHWRRLKRY